MNTIKTAFSSLVFLLVITSATLAHNNPVTSLSTSLRAELEEMVQNPGLVKHNLEEASIVVQFSIDHLGKIKVQNSQTNTPYLINFIEHKVNGQQIDSGTYVPGTTYKVRFRFETQ